MGSTAWGSAETKGMEARKGCLWRFPDSPSFTGRDHLLLTTHYARNASCLAPPPN